MPGENFWRSPGPTQGCRTIEEDTFDRWDLWHRTATAGSDVVQSGRPIFDDFFQHLWPYIGNNTANVVFQMVKRLWLIRIDIATLYIAPQKIV
ncbi:adhesion G protein-coupled receptor B2 [Trichonephila clavipes]|uniref:Adhesion G protein-coupled receptor B2 n=1 Tax=Trichonephila clavipes TaxID=2585209 RepID=A0A8X7BK60_TRICX|nr:adhesion G protein-coupled receptor B2 [Trichonephila clavipes]